MAYQKQIVILPPSADPTKFIGRLNVRGDFHVKLLLVIRADNGERYWKIETREHLIGVIPEKSITYGIMVAPVEVNDCFIMQATVQRHAVTANGEPQTFFRDVEIVRNFGTSTKAK